MPRMRVKHYRKLHLWTAAVIFLPVLIVIVSGLLLQVKKQVEWVQPATAKSQGQELALSFDEILDIVKKVPEAQVSSWDDIDRLDVRPGKSLIKVRMQNHWEVQLDSHSGEVLKIAYRRSDSIEAIHDGSWFFTGAKLWLFLPAAIGLLIMWISGMVLLIKTLKSMGQQRARLKK